MSKVLTISQHYPCALLEKIKQDQDLYFSLLGQAGISPSVVDEPKARVPIESHVRLYREIANIINDEAFGFLPTPIRSGAYAMACEFIASALTIGEALERLCRFYRIVTGDVHLSVTVEGGEARFEVQLEVPELDFHHFVAETFLCIGYRCSTWLAGRAIKLNRAGFVYDKPAHAAEYAYLFPCNHTFNEAKVNYISFDADILRLPVLKTDAEIQAYCSRVPEDLMNKLVGSDSFCNRVYLQLSQKSEDDKKDLASIAKELAVSEKTLRRRLRDEGVSFQQIKDNLRLDTAIFHLSGSKYTVAEISEKLGFSTPGAFSRAFKKWTALSPEQYRQRA